MQFMIRILMVLGICALVSCIGPNPAVKAALDRRVAQIAPSTTAYPASPTRAIPPIKTGQWIQLKTVSSKGEVGLMTIKIIGEEGNAFWQETVIDTYYGRAIMKTLIDFGDQKNHDTVKVLKIVIKGQDGFVLEYPAEALEDNVPHIGMSFSTRLSQEDLQVTAGRFAQSYTGPFTLPQELGAVSGTGWWHPAVPISGMLKYSIREGNALVQEGTWELVGFGLQGATSEF